MNYKAFKKKALGMTNAEFVAWKVAEEKKKGYRSQARLDEVAFYAQDQHNQLTEEARRSKPTKVKRGTCITPKRPSIRH